MADPAEVLAKATDKLVVPVGSVMRGGLIELPLGASPLEVVRIPALMHGYQTLPDILDDEGLVMLSASFSANNGIRIQLLDPDSEDLDWRVFDFTDAQAEQVGAALVRWAKARRHAAAIR